MPNRVPCGYCVNVKRLVALLIWLLAAPLLPALAQPGPDDQYIIIYTLMQQADSSDSSGQPRQALAQYVQVQGELQKFQKTYPDWNPRIVSFRLNYLGEKIAELTAKLPVANPPSVANPPPERFRPRQRRARLRRQRPPRIWRRSSARCTSRCNSCSRTTRPFKPS